MYTICFVEDEKDLSNLIKVYLEKAGYKVVTFNKGADAIDYIGQPVDVWILDIMLEDDISGYDIIKEIRKNNSNVPVIFTSARDQEIDKILGLELGSDDYITKPYSSKELVLRVNNIIKRVYKKEEKAIGLVFADVDVTNGPQPAAIMVEGYVIESRLPAVVEESDKTAMSGIKFR